MAAQSPQALVRVEDTGSVRTITLARVERHNSLVPALLEDLGRAVDEVAAASTIRAVVLAADGPSFSTGGDVAAFAALRGTGRAAYARDVVGRLNDVMLALLRLPQATIAAVHGPVTGGSLGLVLSADIVLVGAGAWFAPYYVDVGFSPDGGWTALLPARIGASRAAAVQLTNERIDAATAVDWGLATRLTDDPHGAAVTVGQQIAGKVPGSVRRTLQLLRPDPDAVAIALQDELDSFVAQITTAEATDGMAAFLAAR